MLLVGLAAHRHQRRSNKSVHHIRFNAHGVRTAQGGRWHISTVQNLRYRAEKVEQAKAV
jgi:hypothetical protein